MKRMSSPSIGTGSQSGGTSCISCAMPYVTNSICVHVSVVRVA